MPLTGFEKYNAEMAAFEKSKLFKRHYHRVIKGLRKRRESINPIARRSKSHLIEDTLDITGAQVRKIISHARRKRIPIGSDNDGYFYAKSAGELDGTIHQLEERGREILFVASRMKQAFDNLNQGNLFDEGKS